MEAPVLQFIRRTVVFACFFFFVGHCSSADAAAGYKTRNFTVSAPSPQLAKEIGDAAEMWRRELSMQWIGKEMPPWSKPCPINAQVAPNMGAGGATSFIFDHGEVFGWKMNIQGSRERILDSVLPHEVTHTIFASYFRQPLPRWADEGACTTVEHHSEIAKQERMLIDFLKTQRGIPFNQMFAMKEYPRQVMPLYAQGHSVSQWLIESRGRTVFLAFLADGMNDENWPRAVERHYGFDRLATMQDAWLDWVKAGRPRLTPETSPISRRMASRDGPAAGRIAAAPPASGSERDRSRPGAPDVAVYRGQSPDPVTPIAAAEPIAPADVRSAPTAAAGESIYAAAAAQAERERRNAANALPSSSAGRSIYDASRGPGVLRR
jgi:hypothetical protein